MPQVETYSSPTVVPGQAPLPASLPVAQRDRHGLKPGERKPVEPLRLSDQPGAPTGAASGRQDTTASGAAVAPPGPPPHKPGCLSSKPPCSNPVLVPGTGPVQHDPKIFLIFWGPKWTGEPYGTRTAIENLFNHLAGTAYGNVLSQYHDAGGTAYVHNDAQVLGDWIDTDQLHAPTIITDTNAASEVQRARDSNPGWLDPGLDAQYMVFVQQGTQVVQDAAACAHHSYVNGRVIDVQAYFLDNTTPCMTTSSDLPGYMTSLASHEFAEAATDPQAQNWRSADGSEIADLCNTRWVYEDFDGSGYPPLGQVETLFDNERWAQGHQDACVLMRGNDTYTAPNVVPRHTIYGAILGQYQTIVGQAKITPGYPISEEYPFHGGRKQDFSNGAMYYSGASGPHAVIGAIVQDYQANFEPGLDSIGFPVSDEHAIPQCACNRQSDFQGGDIVWSGATGAAMLRGAILSTWRSWGGPNGPLGMPTANERDSGNSGSATFEHGGIIDNNGAIEVVLNSGQMVVGHAQHAGNDYPYETLGQFEHQNQGTDAWNEFYGQCDSFTAWKA